MAPYYSESAIFKPHDPIKPDPSLVESDRCGRYGGGMKSSLTMLGMIVGSTLGGIAPMLYGGGVISSLACGTIGGILGIWAGLRFSEWIR